MPPGFGGAGVGRGAGGGFGAGGFGGGLGVGGGGGFGGVVGVVVWGVGRQCAVWGFVREDRDAEAAVRWRVWWAAVAATISWICSSVWVSRQWAWGVKIHIGGRCASSHGVPMLGWV
ncbi:hypothetical protein, partial [Mycolicibacterium thermoresistibile]